MYAVKTQRIQTALSQNCQHCIQLWTIYHSIEMRMIHIRLNWYRKQSWSPIVYRRSSIVDTISCVLHTATLTLKLPPSPLNGLSLKPLPFL